jgi:hypothetical protein
MEQIQGVKDSSPIFPKLVFSTWPNPIKERAAKFDTAIDKVIYEKLDLSWETSPIMTSGQIKKYLKDEGLDLSSCNTFAAIANSSGTDDRASTYYQMCSSIMQIRLLNVMPAKSAIEDIVCELQTVLMTDNPEYDALSYTWGDAAHQRSIVLNGRRYCIGANLWNALRSLRHESKIKTLWIDAVCINQNDLIEKSNMVSQMYIIYHKARNVVAWVGEATQKSEEAMKFLREHLSKDVAEIYPDGLDVLKAECHTSRNIPTFTADRVPWEALLDLFGRAWWTRAWVVQEIVCSHRWTLKCGQSEIDGHKFSVTLSQIHFLIGEAKFLSVEGKRIIRNTLLVPKKMILRQEALALQLVLYRGRQAKDLKDNIYAFTNMVQPPISELCPDYTKSTEEIYYDTAVQIIKMEGNLRLLSVCELHEKRDLEFLTAKDGIFRKFVPELPSWVPNWAVCRNSYELWGGYSTKGISIPFAASGNKPQVINFHGASLLKSQGYLTIRGSILDQVEDVSPDWYGNPLTYEILDDAQRTIAGKSFIHLQGDGSTCSLLRTMTLDRDSQGKRKYEEIANDPNEIWESIGRAIVGRVFFRTAGGFIGLGPRQLKANDQVAIIPGCHVPMILRKTLFLEDVFENTCEVHEQTEVCSTLGCAKKEVIIRTSFRVVGEACKYTMAKMTLCSSVADVHGVMNGELSDALDESEELDELDLGPAKPVVLDIRGDGESLCLESLPAKLRIDSLQEAPTRPSRCC